MICINTSNSFILNLYRILKWIILCSAVFLSLCLIYLSEHWNQFLTVTITHLLFNSNSSHWGNLDFSSAFVSTKWSNNFWKGQQIFQYFGLLLSVNENFLEVYWLFQVFRLLLSTLLLQSFDLKELSILLILYILENLEENWISNDWTKQQWMFSSFYTNEVMSTQMTSC